MRDDWDREWQPGKHKHVVAEHRRAAQTAMTNYYLYCNSACLEPESDGPQQSFWVSSYAN